MSEYAHMIPKDSLLSNSVSARKNRVVELIGSKPPVHSHVSTRVSLGNSNQRSTLLSRSQSRLSSKSHALPPTVSSLSISSAAQKMRTSPSMVKRQTAFIVSDDSESLERESVMRPQSKQLSNSIRFPSPSRSRAPSPVHTVPAQEQTPLSAQQQKLIMDTINEYCPQEMKHIVFQDVVAQIDQLEKQGYTLPPKFQKSDNDIKVNEMHLYHQQVQKERKYDKRKMTYLLNFAALGITWFCQSMDVDWIKTKQLPETVRQSLEEGEFDDSLDGIGTYMRGTVFDNPVFSTTLKFIEKIGHAHHKEIEKEQERLEKEVELRQAKRFAHLKKMDQLRRPTSTVAAKPQQTVSALRAPTPLHKGSQPFGSVFDNTSIDTKMEEEKSKPKKTFNQIPQVINLSDTKQKDTPKESRVEEIDTKVVEKIENSGDDMD